MPFHRRFAEHLARRTGSYVSLLDFPLPPEAQCTDILEAVRAIYRQLSGDYRQHRFILMGDSAGGDLALSLLQELKGSFAGETKNPDGTVLYSPWLDVGLLALEKDSYHTQKKLYYPLPHFVSQVPAMPVISIWGMPAARPFMAPQTGLANCRFL